MDKAELMSFLSGFKGSMLTYPFDFETEVYKVGNKMFALIGKTNGFLSVNLKGLPEDNYVLRSMFNSIIPGYHMNKEHWITVILDDAIDDSLIRKLITDS